MIKVQPIDQSKIVLLQLALKLYGSPRFQIIHPKQLIGLSEVAENVTSDILESGFKVIRSSSSLTIPPSSELGDICCSTVFAVTFWVSLELTLVPRITNGCSGVLEFPGGPEKVRQ